MGDQDLTAQIVIEATGTAQTKALASAVASVSEALESMVSAGKGAISQLNKIEQQVAGVTTKSNTAAASINNIAKAYKNATTAAGNFRAPVVATSAGSLVNPAAVQDSSIGNLSTAASRASQEASNAAKAAAVKVDQQLAAAEAKLAQQVQSVNLHNQAQLTGLRQMQPALTAGGEAFRQNSIYQQYLSDNTATATKRYRDSVDALGSYRDNLANTRYALYGLTNAMGLLGVGILAANILIIKQAADFQTTFANISRTTGATGDDLAKLEQQFISLGQTIPTSFDDLGNIATLAGQLNIPTKQVANFTKVVAEFSATTNVDVNDAATAFGRLDALLPDVKGNFNALGSSILNVGVNSVATESQIIQVSSQIASAGVQAGLTASQVIGLSASFASLGIAAESSRGTTLRVFGLINKAVAQGGDSLDQFAKIAGVSATDFANSWGTSSFINTFQSFLQGIGDKGKTAQLSLSSLGITAARDQNNLLKLSQNTGLVADNLGYAADGFSKATKLQDSFSKITATLAAQSKELLNSFQALFGELGAGGVQIITSIVTSLKTLVVGFTELSKNPLVQGAATAFGALTALSGILLVAGSAVGKAVAAFLAGRPVLALFEQSLTAVRAKLALVQAQALEAGVEMGTFKAGVISAGVALKGLAASSVVLLAVVAAGAAVSAIIDKVNQTTEDNKKANESASTAAKNYFTTLGSLGDAIKQDTDAHLHGVKAYDSVTVSTKKASSYTHAWVSELDDATGGQVKLSKGTQNTTYSVEKQTFSLGANTKAWFANQVANDKTVQNIFKNQARYTAEGLNTTGFITALAKGDTAGAEKIYKDFQDQNAKLTGRKAPIVAAGGATTQNTKDLVTINQLLKNYTGATSAAAKQQALLGIVSAATGTTLNAQTGVLENNTDATDDATDSTQTLAQAIQAAFSNTNTLSSFAKDFETLVDGIYNGSASFDAFSQSGQANIANLQSAIETTIEAGQQLGISATQSVAILFAQLQAQGVNTANLLSSLANIPGVSVSGVQGYLDGTKKMSKQGTNLASVMSQLASQENKANAATKKVGGSAGSAAKQLYTLSQYASDLGTVMANAFSIRFGVQQGLDKITSGWQNIATATADANQKIQEAQATLDGLVADKATQQYFLGIANAYGDTLRAGQIQAQIGTDDTGISSAQTDLTNGQNAASKELEGTSAAAIANRATIEDLVQSYEDYIKSLAASGASQDQLNAATLQSKNDFLTQATQLGFNQTQLGKYTQAFTDASTVISKLPRNITLTASTDAATEAINEFLAQTQTKAAAGGSSAGKAMGDSFASAFASILAQLLIPSVGAALKNGIIPIRGELTGDGSQVYRLSNNGALSLRLFKSGGYTGDEPVDKAAGIVHGKEFVVNAPTTARLGVPFLDALNNGYMPSGSQVAATSGASKSNGAQLVQLTASNLQFIADALSVNLQIGNKSIAQAASASNLSAANKGAN